MLRLGASVVRHKPLLDPHDVQDDDAAVVFPIENPAGGLDDLPDPQAPQLGEFGPEAGVIGEPLHVLENALDEGPRCSRVFQRDMVGDGVEVLKGGLGPDYFSHRPRRRFASAWETVRPSSRARSPRAMPSSSFRRFCRDS